MDIAQSIIIIACERYSGAYPNLPGAINSAHKIHDWAKNEAYTILYLGDDNYAEITTQLLYEHVNHFLDNSYIDRLVVYFAGHGLVRHAGSQFWLLTNAYHDVMEGIHVEGFRRGLAKCNIGANSPVLDNGQICMIGDACRNTDRDGIDFHGHPIVTRARGPNFAIEYDKYFSTELGAYSYQIAATHGQPAYCLFSEILVNALSGLVPTAIEYNYHRFAPAVTNHKLANYLKREVPHTAAIYGNMNPDVITDIKPDYNFYKCMSGRVPSAIPVIGGQTPQAVGMAVGFTNQADAERRTEELSQNLDRMRNVIENVRIDRVRGDWRGQQAILCHGYEPKQICIPVGTQANVTPVDEETFYIILSYEDGFPALLQTANSWSLVPLYPNTIPVISQDLPGDTFLYKFSTGEWDTMLSDFVMLSGDMPRHAIEARTVAAEVRSGKSQFPHQSVVAAYLYEFANDYQNIARTAHFMADAAWSERSAWPVVPFDLALLCAERVYWARDATGVTKAYADLPEVAKVTEEYLAVERFSSRIRPPYTGTALEKKNGVPLWGIAPVFREGWYFLEQNADYLRIPLVIRALSEIAKGRSGTSFPEEAANLFAIAFGYQTIELLVAPQMETQ